MPQEPAQKQVIAFIDGQNLFFGAKKAFGYHYPNYDVIKLSNAVCSDQNGWVLKQTRFYTGIPDPVKDPDWNHFWNAKLAVMGRAGIVSFTRPLKYRTEEVILPDGSLYRFPVKQEKGIDVRLALDIVRLGLDGQYDVALIFSQDQDLSEVADEIKTISMTQSRWMSVASAFPYSSQSNNSRGINNTNWIKVDQAKYDSCIDSKNYRPKTPLVKSVP